jgi:hypothetical protein
LVFGAIALTLCGTYLLNDPKDKRILVVLVSALTFATVSHIVWIAPAQEARSSCAGLRHLRHSAVFCDPLWRLELCVRLPLVSWRLLMYLQGHVDSVLRLHGTVR